MNCPSSSVRPGAIGCVDGASDSVLLPVFIHVMIMSCFFSSRQVAKHHLLLYCLQVDVLHARMKRGLRCGMHCKSPISRPLWRLQCETSVFATWSARYIWSFPAVDLEKEAKNWRHWATCSCSVFGMLVMVPFFWGGGSWMMFQEAMRVIQGVSVVKHVLRWDHE